MLKKLKRDGLDSTNHKPAISEEDMAKFYSSGTLSNANPVALQYKVFLEIGLHFGRRGVEGWRALKKNSFVRKVDGEGRQYVSLAFQEFDKKTTPMPRAKSSICVQAVTLTHVQLSTSIYMSLS